MILEPGSDEPLKAGVHALALGLTAVMGAYNAAAWLRRREGHLAVNTLLYGAFLAWEWQQVVHHVRQGARDAI